MVAGPVLAGSSDDAGFDAVNQDRQRAASITRLAGGSLKKWSSNAWLLL
jgi:hypothetical protein